jgi:hypothetical protein
MKGRHPLSEQISLPNAFPNQPLRRGALEIRLSKKTAPDNGFRQFLSGPLRVLGCDQMNDF